jgi:hypothetical protein
VHTQPQANEDHTTGRGRRTASGEERAVEIQAVKDLFRAGSHGSAGKQRRCDPGGKIRVSVPTSRILV